MKKLFFILLLLPVFAFAQTFPKSQMRYNIYAGNDKMRLVVSLGIDTLFINLVDSLKFIKIGNTVYEVVRPAAYIREVESINPIFLGPGIKFNNLIQSHPY